MARQQKQKDKDTIQWSREEIGLLRKHYPDIVSGSVAKQLEKAVEVADMKKSRFGLDIRRKRPRYKPPQAVVEHDKSEKRSKRFFALFIIVTIVVLFAMLTYRALHTVKPQPNWAWVGNMGLKRLGRLVEVPLCKIESCQALGSPWRYTVVDCEVVAKAQDGKTEQLAGLVTQNDIKIKDSVRSVIAQAKLYQLTDPKLEFITSEVGKKMEKIVGNGTISKILIPQWSVDL
jgi:hypothetical protein